MKVRCRNYSTGSVTDRDGGVRAYLHIARLKKLANSIDVHVQHAPTLLAAAAAMEELSRRNRSMGRQLGSYRGKRLLTAKGASIPLHEPEAADTIADLAADHEAITVYVGRDPRRLRATTAKRLPKTAHVIGRFDLSTDYRVIERALAAARTRFQESA